ncbi:efflux RND transporter periplasmic adaptor subunit [Sphingomonas sp. BIUV-7]|uniref:Efflux RND transporter periplasmic adaptor subunit n=1 Tax=Sphingomonas natans TaxID=3063330 RepID=A0ABT8Y5X7_9SPHN|nr:efflux RND transporter periplasmic adaptor subunit [Sphingomonas sp. BIUV-7]MDO6413129.1 efflux RND transporter periplasmic adaptor subunit [Sphingomonas sp. BIUV-7]
MNMQSGIGGDRADYEVLDPARSRRKLIIALVAALAVVALIGLVMFRNAQKKTGPAEATLQRVTVTIPGHSQIAGSVTAAGTISARHDMPVGIVGEGGMVTQVLVYPGDWVKSGQPLAIVERSVQTQQAASLAAGVAAARADAALAQSNLDRAKALVGNGFISKADIDTRTAARDQANARVNVARAQLAEQQARNARLVIRAPAGGLVLTRTVEPGQIVGPSGGALFRIADKGEMEMLARVAEQDLAHMRIGTAASVTPIGSGKTLTGRIWQLSPIIDPTSRQGVARVALTYDTALRPGGFANASIATGFADVPQLPESAVLSDQKGNYVLIVNAQGVVERREVTVGDVSDAGVSIATGLEGREKVVVNAGAFLSPGEKVLPEVARPAR